MSEAPDTAKRDDTSAAAPGTAQRDGISAEATVQPAAPAPPRSAGWRRRVAPALLVAGAAFLVAAWQWHDSRRELRAIKQELGRRLADTDTQSKESRIVTEQVREAVTDAQVKLGVLEARIAESQNQ